MMSWENMWRQGINPGQAFDVAAPSKCLEAVIDRLPMGRAFVPGAGRAYDAALLASQGRQVVALDVSKTAIASAKSFLSALPEDDPIKPSPPGSVDLVCDDFFTYVPKDSQPFDMIWDCTFLCALEPSYREQWAKTSANLLSPEGTLCTMIFPIGKPDGTGPPFDLSMDIVQSLLSPLGFEPVDIIDLPPGTHMPRMPSVGNMVVSWQRK